MAITGSTEAEGRIAGAARAQKRAQRAATRPLSRLVSVIAAACPLFAPEVCRADRWSIDAAVGSELTWTSNADLGGTTAASDTILAVRPRVRLLGEGARLRISGSAAVNAVGYARKTQPGRLNS